MSKAKKTDTTKAKRNLKYFFHPEELQELGKKLAELGEALGALKADKKRTVKDFDAKVTAVEAEQGIVINQIRSGYEYRELPVLLHFNEPKPGMKTIFREDTNEKVSVEPMTSDELQAELPMEEQTVSE